MPSRKMPRQRAERKVSVASVLAASIRYALGERRRDPLNRRIDRLLEILAEVTPYYRSVGDGESAAVALTPGADLEAAGRALFFDRCEERGVKVPDKEAADNALDALCCARRRGPRGGRGVSWVAAFRDLWRALGERDLATSDDALRAREASRRRRMADVD